MPPPTQVYVFAPLAVNVIAFPEHTMFGPLILIIGLGFTVTVAVTILLQLFALLPVRVYTVVVVGLAITDAVLTLLNPIDGFHIYEVAPLASKFTELPSHNVALLTVTSGDVLTVSDAVFEIILLQVPEDTIH